MVPPGDPGNGSVEPSLASLILPVIVAGGSVNGLKFAGSDDFTPAIPAGELTVTVDC